MPDDNLVQLPGAGAPLAPEPLTIEQRVEALELVLSKMSQEIGGDVAEIARHLKYLHSATQNAFSKGAGAQIIAETVARYVAGYKPGEYMEEVDTQLAKDEPDPIEIKGKAEGFEHERFMDLLRESSEAFVKIADDQNKRAIKKRLAEEQKAESNIILPPEKKIILPGQ